jgi:hypothetical protein
MTTLVGTPLSLQGLLLPPIRLDLSAYRSEPLHKLSKAQLTITICICLCQQLGSRSINLLGCHLYRLLRFHEAL